METGILFLRIGLGIDSKQCWTTLGQLCSWSCQSSEAEEVLTLGQGSSFLGCGEAFRPNRFLLANILLCGLGEWDGQDSKMAPNISTSLVYMTYLFPPLECGHDLQKWWMGRSHWAAQAKGFCRCNKGSKLAFQWVKREITMEKEMATYSSILAWEFSWTEEPGRLQFMASQRAGHNLATEQQPPQPGRFWFREILLDGNVA